jgi:hypothetical protein
MEGHGNPFSVTVGALVGAHFLPIVGWRGHNDSHFLRARRTKQHPGVSKDCPVRLVMLHGHGDSPSVGRGYDRLPIRVCIKLLTTIPEHKEAHIR